MTQPTAEGGRTFLSVNDFGPIARADIDLRPLTIFVGPSNTGKSYLAMLIYALCKCFSLNYPDGSGWSPGYRPWGPHGLRTRVGDMADELWKDIPQERKEMFTEWLKQSRDILSEKGNFLCPDFLQDMMRDAHGKSLGSGKEIGYTLEECFGSSRTQYLTRDKSRNPAAASVSFFDASGGKVADFGLSLDVPETRGGGVISPDVEISVPNFALGMPWSVDPGIDVSEKRFSGWVFRQMCERSQAPRIDLAVPAHFFPADRTGIMHAHRVVVGSLVKSAAHGGTRPDMPTPALSGVVGDFLTGLIDMRDSEGPLSGHGKSIESDILGGEIHIERTPGAGYPTFFYRPKDWKAEKRIPLMRSSSMVSELASIVLYLRHVADKGDLLIIEEPEAHLHPAMQAELAIHLAKLVKAGVRIIVTTHSQYVLEQFANLVCFSPLAKARRPGTETHLRRIEKADLDRSMVSAWLFEPKRKPAGSVVREIPLDPESGTFPMDFTDVSLLLGNEGGMIETLTKSVPVL